MTNKDAQIGYAKRIAATLTEAFRTSAVLSQAHCQVIAKVGLRQRDSLLYVALEAIAADPAQSLQTAELIATPQTLLPILKQTLSVFHTELGLGWLKLAKISGRIAGTPVPSWQAEVLFHASAPLAKTLMRPVSTGGAGDMGGQIGSDLPGQVIVGNHLEAYHYTDNAAHGGVLNVASEHTPQPQPAPIELRPHPFRTLLDRQTVLPLVREALMQAQPVEIYGEVGVGKTVLIRHLADDKSLMFPEGVIYLSAQGQPVADLLQSLYGTFYEAKPLFKPSYTQMQQALKGKRALVILDSLSLDKAEVEWLMLALPDATFVLISEARFYWLEGAAIALKGLPFPESVALIQIELGRALSEVEEMATRSLWTALSGNPLQLRRAAAHAAAQNQSMVELVQSMQTTPGQIVSARSLFQKIAATLSPRQQKALALMGAMGGVALSAAQSQAIAQTPQIVDVLDQLVTLHLVESTETGKGVGYRLSADLLAIAPRSFDPQPWLAKATDYFATGYFAAAHRQANAVSSARESQIGESSTDAMRHLLEWTQRTGQWQKSLSLTRRLDPLLALRGQWDQWQQALTYSLQAAKQLGDGAAEARALHQLGTRSLALGEAGRALPWLSRALQLRDRLNDKSGAAVTRHNIGLMVPSLVTGEGVPPAIPGQRYRSRGRPKPKRRFGQIAAGIALIGAMAWLTAKVWSAVSQDPNVSRQVSVSNSAIAFGPRVLNSASDPKGVTIINKSDSPIKIRQVVLSGSETFVLAGTTAAEECQVELVLAPAAGCVLSAVFSPATVGKHQAEMYVVIEESLPAEKATQTAIVQRQSQPVALSGTGTPEAVASLSFDVPGIDFPQTLLKERSRQLLTLSNDGSAPLSIFALNIAGWQASSFEVIEQTCTQSDLAPGESCRVVVAFAPTAIGDRTAELVVKNNASNDATLTLTGVGTAILPASPSSVPPASSPPVPEVSPPPLAPPPVSSPGPDASSTFPQANDDRFVIKQQTPARFDVLANDSNPEALSIVAVGQGRHGSVRTDGRQIEYFPSEEFSPTDSFTYEVSNEAGDRAIATVIITIELSPSDSSPPDSGPPTVETPDPSPSEPSPPEPSSPVPSPP
ncbi:MAG: choice-of-anchor D domain-containing protein [Phormidesmis sp.]